ncbi:hypothetical protein G647_07568 [Cladophialophora carrionii CBS 160.54]|uniref:Uncharacterized protein n=1 Tax=Cladophialophora carrionii CBS 160.54 TaxID=1279043 RepID=V9D4K4_9EURO|nr:uncharacterized protein G647_07568 [Cladophialophora carrionii CBS 160.54]ETI21223.1 hypothetical protein G647_07568 [Cladophialophora carrionii CBS 160.54]
MGLSPSIVQHTSTVLTRLEQSHHNLDPDQPRECQLLRQQDRHTSINIGMKRSPHSDPGPGQPQPQPQPQAQGQAQAQSQLSGPQVPATPNQTDVQPSLEQWNLVLDTIRSNLNLIVGTWGRRSRQYDEARGVMLAYLEDNLGRLRLGELGPGGGMALEPTTGARPGHNGKGDVDMMATVERSIEELMGELKI